MLIKYKFYFYFNFDDLIVLGEDVFIRVCDRSAVSFCSLTGERKETKRSAI